jgi:hypothetical protein
MNMPNRVSENAVVVFGRATPKKGVRPKIRENHLRLSCERRNRQRWSFNAYSCGRWRFMHLQQLRLLWMLLAMAAPSRCSQVSVFAGPPCFTSSFFFLAATRLGRIPSSFLFLPSLTQSSPVLSDVDVTAWPCAPLCKSLAYQDVARCQTWLSAHCAKHADDCRAAGVILGNEFVPVQSVVADSQKSDNFVPRVVQRSIAGQPQCFAVPAARVPCTKNTTATDCSSSCCLQRLPTLSSGDSQKVPECFEQSLAVPARFDVESVSGVFQQSVYDDLLNDDPGFEKWVNPLDSLANPFQVSTIA